MEPYSKHRPTAVDPAGAFLDDERQDWLVLGVAQTRDSDVLARCNFLVVSEILDDVDPDGVDHEIHRFGHWGPGWYEIIIVRPDSQAYREAVDIEAALADYPVLCDSRYSEMELEEAREYWSSSCIRQRVRMISEHNNGRNGYCGYFGCSDKLSVFAARRDEFPEELLSHFRD